jgi:hypothetical protein
MSNQKQVNEGGNATLSVKVSQETYELLNILAEGLHHGTNANDLLKMFVQAFIESAKHCGPVSQDIQLLLDMLKIEGDWSKAFNFADITKQKRIAQVVLILEQPGREGYGAVLINRPYLPGKKPYMTYCVDDILERVAEVSMKGVYQRLRDIGNEIGTQSLRETLLKLIEDYKKHSMWLQFEEEGPQLGNYSDFGRAIEYGNRAKRKKHLTPDSIQQRIVFGDDDREAADMEAQDWEGEHRNPENDTPPDDFRPHGEEW